MTADAPPRDDGRVVRILDQFSEVPYYVQLANRLEEQIRRGEFRERRKLSSKRVLMEEYEVSADTVEKAIDRLKERGLVVGQQGKGVFAVPFDKLPPEKQQ